jgi:rubrerythrin
MDKDIFKDKAALLKNAIKGEEDGIAFYDLLADRAVNPEARRRLEQLRDDEKRHKSILINLYRKHVGGEVGPLPTQGTGPLAQAFDKGKLKIFKSEMEYINLAIETEIAVSRFYKEATATLGEKDFIQVLLQLSEEENSHYEILMAEREAMAGNYHWFSSDFGAPMED